MTPERKKWWDSLPTEEKNTRIVLNREKEVIKHNKNNLANEKGYVARKIILATIKHEKAVIKALRKQIGLNVVNLNKCPTDWGGRCPTCGNCRIDVFHNQHNCGNCGQKLRW